MLSVHRMTKHPRLPETKGVPRTQVFHAKTSSAPKYQGWVGHPILLTQITPKSTFQVSLLIFYSPFPTTLGNTSLANPTFASKNTFHHSFVYSANTSWTPCVIAGFRQQGKNNEEKRQKSLPLQGDSLAWQRQAISKIEYVLRPNTWRKMRPKRGMESIREREEDSALDRKTQKWYLKKKGLGQKEVNQKPWGGHVPGVSQWRQMHRCVVGVQWARPSGWHRRDRGSHQVKAAQAFVWTFSVNESESRWRALGREKLTALTGPRSIIFLG